MPDNENISVFVRIFSCSVIVMKKNVSFLDRMMVSAEKRMYWLIITYGKKLSTERKKEEGSVVFERENRIECIREDANSSEKFLEFICNKWVFFRRTRQE